jgi:hypothetical protein
MKEPFHKTLNEFVNSGNKHHHTMPMIKYFFNFHDISMVNSYIGDKKVQENLNKLSRIAFKKAKDSSARLLAFQIQSLALSLIPDLSAPWGSLPRDLQKIIFYKVCQEEDSYKPLHLLLVSKKEFTQSALSVRNDWINANETNLIGFNCYTFKETLKYIIDHQLTSADLGIQYFYDNDLEELVEKCPQLKKLRLTPNRFTSDKLNFALGKFTNLQCLTLNRCHQIFHDSFVESLEGLVNLEKLHIGFFDGVYIELDHIKLLALTDKIIETVGKLPKIKSLNLANLPMSLNQLKDTLGKLNLQYLNLDGYHEISSDELYNILKKHPNLTHLSLRNIPLSDKRIRMILRKLPLLETLNVSCKDRFPDVVRIISEKYPALCLNIT